MYVNDTLFKWCKCVYVNDTLFKCKWVVVNDTSLKGANSVCANDISLNCKCGISHSADFIIKFQSQSKNFSFPFSACGTSAFTPLATAELSAKRVLQE